MPNPTLAWRARHVTMPKQSASARRLSGPERRPGLPYPFGLDRVRVGGCGSCSLANPTLAWRARHVTMPKQSASARRLSGPERRPGLPYPFGLDRVRAGGCGSHFAWVCHA